MLKKIVALFVMVLMVSQMSLARPGAAATHAEVDWVVSKNNYGVQLLNQFWSAQFRARRLNFTPPQVVLAIRNDVDAFYHPRTHTIYLNPLFLLALTRKAGEQTDTDGDMAIFCALAHEYGHAVQGLLGQLGADCTAKELQADSLAGAFVKNVRERGLLEAGDFDEATYTLFFLKDSIGTTPGQGCPHGNGSQRVYQFQAGATQGLNAAALRW